MQKGKNHDKVGNIQKAASKNKQKTSIHGERGNSWTSVWINSITNLIRNMNHVPHVLYSVSRLWDILSSDWNATPSFHSLFLFAHMVDSTERRYNRTLWMYVSQSMCVCFCSNNVEILDTWTFQLTKINYELLFLFIHDGNGSGGDVIQWIIEPAPAASMFHEINVNALKIMAFKLKRSGA